MVDQEKVSGNNTPRPSPPSADGVEDIAHRLVLLLELQTELFRIDFRNGMKHLILSGVFLCAVGLVSIAGGCILLIFLAELLADLVLPRSAAFGIVVLLAVGLVAAAAVAAWKCLQASLRVFDRSREEFGRTMQWVRHMLKHPTSTNPRQGRRV
jgi:hypothetical protein